MTAVENQVMLNVLHFNEFNEVTTRKSSKGKGEFITGSFDGYSLPQNGKADSTYNKYVCYDAKVIEKITIAHTNTNRVSMLVKTTDNNWIKNDKAGNPVIVDGIPLKIYGKQHEIFAISDDALEFISIQSN